jgi:chromosome segregation ATPase
MTTLRRLSRIAELVEDLGTVTSGHRLTADKLTAANARVAELERQNSRLITELHQAGARVDSANDRASESNAEVNILEGRLDTANARAEAAERDLQEFQASLTETDLKRADLYQRALRFELERDEWKAECEAAEQNMKSSARAWQEQVRVTKTERDDWKAKCEAAEQREQAYKAAFEACNEALTRAESEAASLRAEVERLRAQCEARQIAWERQVEKKMAAEARLAAATELLEQAEGPNAAWRERCDAFLANAPAVL